MERQRLINAVETIIKFLDLDEVNTTTVNELLWGLAEHVDQYSEESGEPIPRWVSAVMKSMPSPDSEMDVEKLKAGL